MIIRAATPADAEGMCKVVNPLIEAGGTTALRTPFTAASMTKVYIERASLTSCSVAEAGGVILGFQSLELAAADTGHVPQGWGIIATFAQRGGNKRGVGTALFQRTLEQAKQAGISTIDATIRTENTGGQIYYTKMGFVDWTSGTDTVSKRYDV